MNTQMLKKARLGAGSFRTSARVLCVVMAGVLLRAGSLAALEASGTLQKVDAATRVVKMYANGGDRVVTVAEDAQILGLDGKPLAGGLSAKELQSGAAVSIVAERGDRGPVVKVLRLGAPRSESAPSGGKVSVGLKPLSEMTAEERYKGEDGGLYGGGRNEPPPAQAAAAARLTDQIVPLDAEGKPSAQGKIGLVSISMSNATMEFSLFKRLADEDPLKSPDVAIVDCAQGGQAMAEWVDPAARAWAETERRLAQAGVSPQQVQVVWVKLANKGPRGELAEHGGKLTQDTRAVLRNAKSRFPNLRIAYLGSRIYAGYASTGLNPEPYAYEGAFAVRWLIRDQAKGDAELAYEGSSGAPKVPLLLWGPYFWADGTTPRKGDGLVWERSDLGGDGTHPSESGRRKVAEQLLKFFKQDALASRWFVRKAE
jgi:hypothetical protein